MGADKFQELVQELAQERLSNEAEQFLADLDSGQARFVQRSLTPADNPLSDEEPMFHFVYDLAGNRKECTLAWSEKLKDELLRRGFKLDKPDDEVLRAGMHLLANVRLASSLYGGDYVDSVLWEVINDRFGRISVIKELLDQLHHTAPYQGRSYVGCKEFLKHAIDGYGNSLVFQLRYSNKEAYPILVGAICHLLDRRHSITIRKILFP